MFGLIVKLIEFGIDKWSGTKIQQASSEVEREKILADVEKNKDQVRGMILSKGSYWFQLFFIIPLAVWFSIVVLYSIFWCKGCMYPQPWSIAALPPPLNDWAGWIVGFLFLANAGRK
jgi:hypothetical protein